MSNERGRSRPGLFCRPEMSPARADPSPNAATKNPAFVSSLPRMRLAYAGLSVVIGSEVHEPAMFDEIRINKIMTPAAFSPLGGNAPA